MRVNGKVLNLDRIDFKEATGVFRLDVSGAFLIKKPRYEDARGAFQELWRLPEVVSYFGKKLSIQQAQISCSTPGVIRGFHAEFQTKFMTPLSGKITIVFLDLRKKSATYLNWRMLTFDNEIEKIPFFYTLVVPPGVANSLCVHGKNIGMNLYGMSGIYDPKSTGMGLSMFDPNLSEIPWPVKLPDAIFSDRDKTLPLLSEVSNIFPKDP